VSGTEVSGTEVSGTEVSAVAGASGARRPGTTLRYGFYGPANRAKKSNL
jgi:hypothetical protein